MTRLVAPTAALLALSATLACSDSSEGDQPPGAVTQSQAAALDDAAAMIDERRLPEGLVPDDGAMPPAAAPRETGGPEPMELPQ
ncbi:MAG TPA: hypothetical protein DHU71_02450 [Erythrobacter sp.]|nr:hypothetical protein [Erythrobacter sp.]